MPSLSVLFLLFTLLPPQSSSASEHPVPLPADFDAAKCVECHEDKTKGKSVHAAVTAGCTSCHQVTSDKEKTEITLLAKDGELCAMCHDVKKDAPASHAPYANGQCTSCHDPHVSEFPRLTRAAGNALCSACHVQRPAKDGKVVLFGNKELAAEEFAKLPKIEVDAAGKLGHPFLAHPVTGGKDPVHKDENYGCLSCHQPHAAELPKLLPAEWKELEVCERCHTAMRDARKKP